MKAGAAAHLVAATLVFFVACDPGALYDDTPSVKARYIVSDGAVLWETTKERLVHIEADLETPKVEQIYRAAPGIDMEWVARGPGLDAATEVFILTVPEDVRDSSAATTLLRLAIKTGKIAEWETGKAFESIAFDPTARYAILSHGESSSSASLTNPGEIAVIDLERPGDGPVFHDLYTAGRRTKNLVFKGPVDIAGKTRQLGIAFAEGAVRLFDLADLGASLPLIPLITRDDGRSVTPVEIIVLGQENGNPARLFIRAQGSQDIYDVTLDENPQEQNKPAATLNQHETGTTALDMLVYRDGERLLLLCLADGRGLRVVDADTGAGFDVPLADQPSKMALRGDEAVIFGASRAVHFAALEGLWAEKGSNVETIYLPVLVGPEIAADENRIIFLGNDDSLVLLDIEQRRATRLAGAIEEIVGANLWNGRLFFPQRELIDVVELENGGVEQLYLDDWIEGFSVIPSAKIGIAWHEAWTGRATLVALEDPTRDKAVVLDGIWLEGFLGKGAEK